MTFVKNRPVFVNQIFEDVFNHFNDHNNVSNVAVNIHQTTEAFTVEVNAPGRVKEDFKINAANGLLTISYEAKPEEATKDYKTLKREFAIKSFKRNFNLEDNINLDSIEAKYDAGILSVLLPKKPEVIVQPKSIVIN